MRSPIRSEEMNDLMDVTEEEMALVEAARKMMNPGAARNAWESVTLSSLPDIEIDGELLAIDAYPGASCDYDLEYFTPRYSLRSIMEDSLESINSDESDIVQWASFLLSNPLRALADEIDRAAREEVEKYGTTLKERGEKRGPKWPGTMRIRLNSQTLSDNDRERLAEYGNGTPSTHRLIK
jgi:hypothetical protein